MIDDLKEAISLFHDGYFNSYEIDNNNCIFKVEIEYLAQTYNKNFTCFYLKIYDLDSILLKIYKDESERQIVSLKEIIKLEPGITSCANKENTIIIHGDVFDSTFNDDCYSELSFTCTDFTIYDQDMNVVILNKLQEVASEYWA